ncbi:hypothetical protein T459_02101 [Capsicum annuum]|uniref:CNNM transmembrane domain-containing protein n=1 Tax=Capsicum annuum TaxID=4072 RepID=A0A2G3AJ05_CAPAN|nr:hypothetical protein T459_02101 [Capsicum annuum]
MKIIPQSICTHYGLTVGATIAPIVQLLLWLFFLIAYPISKVLDWMLGKGHAALLRRAELKTFVDFHGNELIFYVPREKSKLGHWILGDFDFTDWCIYVDDYNRTRRGDKVVQKVMLPYQTLIPYFLKKVNFYLEKGIAKSENDTLSIKMVDELPQQTQCDCGAFVWASAEYVIHGRDIPKEIDISHVCTSYGTLLWDYGKRKLEAALHSLSVKENQESLFCKLKKVMKHKPAEDIKKWNHALSSFDLSVSALATSLIQKLSLKARTFSTTSCGGCNHNRKIKVHFHHCRSNLR